MAFDLSTAKPVKSGFNLATAKPVPRGTRMQKASANDSFIGKMFADVPGADIASEFASGVVRGVTEGIDFLTTDAFNAASDLVGSDVRAPRLTDAAQSIGAGREAFMEPGIAQQIVATAGEFAPAVAGIASQASGIPSAVDRVFSNGIKALENGSPQAKAIAKRLNEAPQKLKATTEGIKAGDAAQAGKKLTSTGRVVADKSLSKAVSQGFDEGVLASLRAGTVQDKQKLKRILDLREKGLRNVRTGMVDRASDVVGSSIKQRLDYVVKTNKDAGKRLGEEIKKIGNKRLDFNQSINDFFGKLDEARVFVDFDDEGKQLVEFAGSRFEDLSQSERLIKIIAKRVDRLANTQSAIDAHELKRFIDEQVTYGKSQGLSGEAERIVKGLRSSLDGVLDGAFDGYRKANEDYANTIRVINDLQGAAGKKIDISGKNADKALGTLARTVMSNNRGRIELVNTLEDLQKTATQYGAKLDDDILLQALFVDELDTVFKPAARTSLAGDVAKSAVDVGAEAATGGSGVLGAVRTGMKFAGDKLLGRNEEAALKAIREFLEQ